jgi:membrane dipeptidase
MESAASPRSAFSDAPDSLVRRAWDLHRGVPVVDAHCDALCPYPERPGFRPDLAATPDTDVDLPRLRDAGVDVQVFAVFVDPRRDRPDPWADVLDRIDVLESQEAAHTRAMEIAREPGSLDRIIRRGRIAAVLSLEGASAIGRDLSRLETLHSRGIRLLGLTWNSHTGWADGCDNSLPIPAAGGLSPFGRKVVRELNRLGIVPDVAHAAPETMDAVLETSSGPVVSTHACARSLCDHPRNLADRHLKGIATSGGVIGVCFCPSFLSPGGDADITTVADHIDHMVKIAGEDHVGLGSDFDGIPSPLSGLEDVSRLPRLTAELLRRGYPEAVLLKILGGNWLRILRGAAGL